MAQSLLPTRNPQGSGSVSPEEHKSALRAKYEEADFKLSELEEEYDFLIRCSRDIRAQQTELARCDFECLDSSSNEKAAEIRDDVVKRYMELGAKNRTIRNDMAALKNECIEARNECSHLFAKYREYGKHSSTCGEIKDESGSVLNEARKFKQLDDHGALDMETSIEGALDMLCTSVDVALLVGGLGATTAMTTYFSATRGRLDMIAWAYGCFVSVIVTCSAARGIIPFRKRALKDWVQSNYTRNRKILVFFVVGMVAFPLSIGQIFLLFAVVLLDPSAPSVVPGSMPAIYVSGYLTLAWLSLSWVAGWNVLDGWAIFAPPQPPIPRLGHNMLEARREKATETTSNPFPSHILPPQMKWEFMPGGPKFFVYRQWRRSHMGVVCPVQSHNVALK